MSQAGYDSGAEKQDTSPSLDAVAASDGTFRMVAIDQRESLRTLLVSAGHASDDTALTAFKVAVTRALSSSASGLLIDPAYGLDAVVGGRAVAPQCGLVVAVDRLVQARGGALTDSRLDRSAMTAAARSGGVEALKFLVIWRPGDPVGPRLAMAREFVERCRELRLVSVLEGLVQVSGDAAPDTMDEAVLAAATEFAPLRPDLYKTHLPTLGTGSDTDIRRKSEVLSAAIGRPWVVLSAGVDPNRFPSALAAACMGGASGFLAGRGVWGPALDTSDPVTALASDARDRLAALVTVAETYGRPWREVVAGP
jgi:sulfofructosephosphate aldolase